MRENELLKMLRQLEVNLQQPEVRRDARRLDAMLHHDFREFGRSGRSYDRAEILAALAAAEEPGLWCQDFALRILSVDVALLTYKSARLTATGTLEDHALRTSIWQRLSDGWRLSFHQGTPTSPFAKATS